MNPALRVERLQPYHARSAFDCGAPALNQYLARNARQDFERGIAVPYLLVDPTHPEHVLGFYTLSAMSLESELIPPLPHGSLPPHRSIGVALLGRFAIHRRHQREGLGALLLHHAFEKTLAIRREIGIVGFVVDVKPSAFGFYLKYPFVSLDPTKPRIWIPCSTIQQVIETTSRPVSDPDQPSA